MINRKNKPFKLSFIGGGINSSIGKIHIISSQLDNNFEIVSGMFSRDNHLNRKTSNLLKIDKSRIYNDINSLIKNEKKIVDAFVILAPTPDHFKILKTLINQNVNIIVEKPILSNLKEVKKLKILLKKFKKKIYLIHNYTGYPAVREIKELVRKKIYGKLLNINISMTQESFLRIQKKEQQVKKWRKNDGLIPHLFLDLGSHVFKLAQFLITENPSSLFTDISKYNNILVDAKMLIKYRNSKKGFFWISKSSLGNRNNLSIELYFEKASIKWSQEDFENIYISYKNGHVIKIDRSVNSNILNEARYNRYRMGHPAGFIEAFANIYEDIASDFSNTKNDYTFNHLDGFEIIKILDKCVISSLKQKWIKNSSI